MSEEILQQTPIYDENSISVLEGLEAVRKRPGMYIGSVGSQGLHHCVAEIVDNSVDEAVAGVCDKIHTIINEDESLSVEDNGRGIPCGIHPKKGTSTLEVILATLHSGGKFGQGGYATSGGLHGVGSSVVNALSVEFEATVHRDGNIYQQHYSKGIKQDEVSIIGKTDKNGTIIKFKPDDTIFNTTEFEYNTILKRLRERAFLNKNITFILDDKRLGKEQSQTLHYEGGLIEFVKYLNEDKETIQDNICNFDKQLENNYRVEIAFQYTDGYTQNIYSYTNNILNNEGGTHVTGFYDGLTKALNEYGRKFNIIKENQEKLIKEDVKDGITSVISVRVPEPIFEGQTKSKLGNTEVRGIVDNAIREYMEIFLIENKAIADQILEKVLYSQKIRLETKKAKESKRKKGNSDKPLPSKIAVCTGDDVSINEFIVVEGDSAGGSAKQSRNRRFQTVMPSKGKIMNVEKKTFDKVSESEELKIFANAIGTGMGDEFNIDNLKYNFILLMQDADSDGGHIRCLWLTYLYRYMRELIEQGHVYQCVSPLYKNVIGHNKVNGKKEEIIHYTYTEEEQIEYLKTSKPISIQRYKGLGEMNPEQLWDTTLNPETRTLIRLSIEDAIEAEKTITMLMGDFVAPRKEFIKDNSKNLTVLDI